MIELDSASGIIQIPKVYEYQDLMDKLKNILQVDDELFKYLYFSYVDENEQERIRLNSQIYDDFINQETPKLTIGFLENVDEKTMDEFKDIIDSNKKRFKEMNYVFPDEGISIQYNNINLDIDKEDEKEEEKVEEEIKEEEKEENEENKIEEIIIEKVGEKMEEESQEKEGETNIKIEEKKEENKEEEKKEDIEENIILIENNNDFKKMEIENNNNDLNLNKINSENSEKFNLLELSKLNSKDINNFNNIQINKDSEEFNNKDSDNFHLMESSEIKLIEIDRNISDNILPEENKNIEEDEFGKNIENIITSNIENIKEDIIQSILIENSKIQQNSKMKKKGPKNSYVHENYICHNCQVSPIKGIRYHCLECNDYDLCEKCEAIIDHNHPLYKIKKDNSCKFKNENYN